MPIRALPRFTAWSYTRFADYKECPLKAKLKHLDKIVEPAGEALERGAAIHKEAEAYVGRRLEVLPESLARFPEEFAALRARRDVESERQMAVTASWQPCEWFARDAWLRVVVDATYAGVLPHEPGRTVIDYKTGKIRQANADQLDLYGLVMLAYYPGVKCVDSALWYLDQGEIVSRTLTPSGAPALRERWGRLVLPMLSDETFAPKPSNGCRWCFYGVSGVAKGGPGMCRL